MTLVEPQVEAATLLEPQVAEANAERALVALFLRDDAEKPGMMIGRYKLLEEIGEGGFGIVWRAEQTGDVRREVALKVIKPGMDSREIIARFEAERQALAMMNHPHIAQMLEGGSTLHGRPYFAMEYVKGQPITQFCDERRLPLEARIRIFVDVCSAVQHAHQKAILHRDLKPSNILVGEASGQIVAKVIDFGVAKALGSQLTDKTMFTMVGTAIGTPQYMSPEQAGVLGQDVDTRSDIYSLGVILYELLTGSTPMKVEDLRKGGLANLKDWLRDAEPERPSTRIVHLEAPTKQKVASNRKTELRKLPRALRGDLDWIVMRALEKDRNRRYQTANGLALDLERYLKGDAVEAGPPSASYRLGKLAQRYRGALTAAALLLISVLVGVGFTVWQAVRATKAEKLASLRLTQAEGARDAAEDLINEAIPGLRKSLLALGKVEIMEDMVAAADAYYKKLPAELANEGALRHKSSLALNRALIAAALGRDKEQEEQTIESLRLTEQLAALHPDEEQLQDDACYGMLTLCYLYNDRSAFDQLVKTADNIIVRCDAWLAKKPESLWSLRYKVLAHNLAAQALVRYGGKVAEGFARFQLAVSITAYMRKVAGETPEVCEAEGINHYGNAKVAERLGNLTLRVKEYEASTASFARALELELGDGSALLREMYVGALHHAGAGIRDHGKITKDEEEQKRGEDMIRKAFEGRAKLVELEPGRAEWWRDLAHSYHMMSLIALDHKDLATELQYRKDSLRCREEAAKRQPTRPLLFDELAGGFSGLADVLVKLEPPDSTQAAELLLRGLEAWKKGVEMAGMKSINNRQIKSDMDRLCKVAATNPKAAVAWLAQARQTLEPLVGKIEGSNDVLAALAKVLSLQAETLASLGQNEPAAEAKAALDKLTGTKGEGASNTTDVAKLLIDTASPEYDAISKLPPDRQPEAVAKVEAAVKRAIQLLEPLVAKENTPGQRYELGRAWLIQARLLRWHKQWREAHDAYSKTLSLFDAATQVSNLASAEQELGDMLREQKDYPAAIEHYTRVAKIRDDLTQQPGASADSFRAAGQLWSNWRTALLSSGDIAAALKASDAELQRYQRAHELDPKRNDIIWSLASGLLQKSRIHAQLKDDAAAITALDQSMAHFATLLPQETNFGRLDGLNNYAGDAYSKLRESKNYAGAEKALKLVIIVRQRFEAVRSWPEEVNKSSIDAQLTMVSLVQEQGRIPDCEALLTAALEAADRSARPAIIASAHARARTFFDVLGRHAEAEAHIRIAYETSQQTDLGAVALNIAGDYAMTLRNLKRYAEAEKIVIPAWDMASTRTWPNESQRLRSDLANKICSLFITWYNAEPSDARKIQAVQWAERAATTLPMEGKLNEGDIAPALLVWMWRMATWVEAGDVAAYKRQRTKLLALAKGRQQPDICNRAAKLALLLPAEADELAAAVTLADIAFRAMPVGKPPDEFHTFSQGLALYRSGKHEEALAVLQPVIKSVAYDRLFSIRSIAALAHHALGQTEQAKALLTSMDKMDARALAWLSMPADRDAAVSRVLLREARAAVGP